MGLISQQEVETKLNRGLTEQEQTLFNVVGPAVQSYVEKIIGSSVEEVGASTRYYNGGVQHLRIDPCTNVTAVIQVDDDETLVYTYDTTDYAVFPRNETLKRQLINRTGPFMTGIYNIGVTAKFSIYGDSAILNVVRNALLEALTSELEASGNIVKETIEGYSVEFGRTETRDVLDSVRYLFPEV